MNAGMPAIINNTKMKKTTLINKFEKSIDEVLEALYASRDILELADDIELDEQANELVEELEEQIANGVETIRERI
ncbi:MAG: hypothetical protein OEV22_17895, partial [Deltaproteobacteria bacterium]|nr:hypothetical protein [Deltaproteobacteria bacterium]